MNNKADSLSRDRLRGLLVEGGARPEDLDRYEAYMSRRGFFGRVGALAALAGLGAGTDAALRGLFGQGLIPVAWAQDAETESIASKPDMIVHTTRPINGEFAPHLLDDDVTPRGVTSYVTTVWCQIEPKTKILKGGCSPSTARWISLLSSPSMISGKCLR